MSKSAMNLQDSFLNQVRRENAEVKVLLVNGTMLRGNVKGFDNFTLVLNSRNGQHLIYKHAIAQLLSHRPASGRPHSEEHAAAADGPTDGSHGQDDSAAGEAATDATPDASVAPASARPPQERRERGPNPNRTPRAPRAEQRDKKPGFNTLDLSNVKIDEKK